MSKLIATYRAAPTTTNRAKLARYLKSHPMALCFATAEEQEFLEDNLFTPTAANRAKMVRYLDRLS